MVSSLSVSKELNNWPPPFPVGPPLHWSQTTKALLSKQIHPFTHILSNKYTQKYTLMGGSVGSQGNWPWRGGSYREENKRGVWWAAWWVTSREDHQRCNTWISLADVLNQDGFCLLVNIYWDFLCALRCARLHGEERQRLLHWAITQGTYNLLTKWTQTKPLCRTAFTYTQRCRKYLVLQCPKHFRNISTIPHNHPAKLGSIDSFLRMENPRPGKGKSSSHRHTANSWQRWNSVLHLYHCFSQGRPR